MFVLFPLAAALVSSIAHSADEHRFIASCIDTRIETYRYDRELHGKLMENGWFPGDRFHQNWRFEYRGGQHVLVDGKSTPILAEAGPVLVVGDAGETAIAAGMWVYVIHRDLKVIAAAQVNGYASDTDASAGIKTRSVELKCEFKVAGLIESRRDTEPPG